MSERLWRATTVVNPLPGRLLLASTLIAALSCFAVFRFLTSKSNKDGIPSVAPRWQEWFSVAAFKKGKEYMEEGYRKYPNSCFRMPLYPMGNVVIVNGPKLIAELSSSSDEIFSFLKFTSLIAQKPYTFSKVIVDNLYHVPVIRTTLTRNLASIFPDIADEMQSAFKETFGESTDWKQYKTHSSLMRIVCRTSNRVTVGSTLCRNEEFLKMNVEYTMDTAKAAIIINLFPPLLHPIVGPFFSPRERYTKLVTRLLKDEIESRLSNFEKYGSAWADKPNDYLMWLIEAASPGPARTVSDLTARILHINFAAIHTSSITFTHALLHLASHPEWIKPLREEVDRIVAEEGWTKASMQKMHKVDSFLRESSRMNAVGLTSFGRYALQDYTFSDGTKVPKGTWVAGSGWSVHMDNENYPNADTFTPFRFAEMRNDHGEETKHQMSSTSPEYLSFGLGKHACPGRFFATNEIKAMLCYVVMNYDIKLPGDAFEKPPNQYFGFGVLPSAHDEILLRKRQGTKGDE